jgi:nucleoid-associated protein YgaU
MATIPRLSLAKNNLYANGFIIPLQGEELLLKRDKLQYTPVTTRDKYHSVTDQDTLWNIAYKYYKDSKRWHIIADVNNIYNPLELTPGASLLIPDIDQINLRLF